MSLLVWRFERLEMSVEPQSGRSVRVIDLHVVDDDVVEACGDDVRQACVDVVVVE